MKMVNYTFRKMIIAGEFAPQKTQTKNRIPHLRTNKVCGLKPAGV
jgi:hypothetical protein